ncbi:DUF4177 domain-containing protein [Paraglaciecola marina]|uniref:DUF4177 domain-containing protein n=1 Tax=Paraglaciecola marina TaxID=2500157 RepID=UPI00105ED0DB|nr:DUF4177 domain-containing protein [Paraglaciecola marina]
MQWEYKVVNIKAKAKGFITQVPDTHELEVVLNDLGRQNWELVSCTLGSTTSMGSSHSQAVLKRPR